MLGLDANILFSALFSLLGMASSVGVALFVVRRWSARVEDRLQAIEVRIDHTIHRMDDGFAAVD